MNQKSSVFAKAGRSISRKEEDRGESKKSKLNIGSSPEIPSRLNAISFKYNRDMSKQVPLVDQRRKIRLVSLIDSKPINHYITLLTLKEFSKREQEMSGVAGSIPTTSGLKEKEHQKNQDVAKILREDLNERYEERIGRRYAAYKAEQEKLQIEKQGLNADLQGKIGILDKHRDASSPANSAESRDHSKGRRISKRPKNQGKSDVENTSVTNKSKDLQLEEKIKGYMVSDTHKEMDEKFKRDYIEICEDLNNKEKEQREQEMSSENKIENEEQARRLQQLKRDQELAEFEEKGGFARILNNLFNPSDESIELDSVYQLKQLCKSYYETKSKISKDLIETLDALLNERPHAISMKKKSFYNEEDGK